MTLAVEVSRTQQMLWRSHGNDPTLQINPPWCPEWDPLAAPVKQTQSLTGWNRKFWMKLYVSCTRWKMKSLMPSDKKSAESVHPNLIWAAGRRRARGGAGGGWTCRCTDARTGKCSLNVSVTLRCHDVRRRDVVPTFKSAGQRKKKWKKETERKRDRGWMRQRSRRNKGMDKESLKGLMNSNRGWKIYWKMNGGTDGQTFVLSLVSWSSLCTYRLSQPGVATLCSLFSPVQVLRRKYFCFLSFYCFII